MSFIGAIIAIAIIGSLLVLAIWILYYHYRNRRLGLTNQPFLPPLPSFFHRKARTNRGTSGGPVDLEGGTRPYEGLGGDEAWDAREEYEGTRLNAGARGFDGQEERGVRYDDGGEEVENPFGDNVAAAGAKGENPFGSGARKVEAEEGKGKGTSSGSRRSLFNEDI
jgi:hypothetical protein